MIAFADLLESPLRSGFTVPAASRGSGVRMLNMGELFRYPRVPDIEMVRVSAPNATEDRAYLKKHDLLFARRSLTLEGAGKCAIVAAVSTPTTWESSIIRARIDASKASALYVYYYFRSPQGRRQMETIVEQVAAAGIRLTELAKLTVPDPPLREQQAIAEVLGALDDKIAANTALAKAVDVLLAMEFRARLHQTEAGDEQLGAIATVVLGGTPSRAQPDYWTNGTIPWLNSGAVNATRIVEPSELITDGALANSAAKMMPRGATLLAITGATLGQIARLEMNASGNQSIVGVWSTDASLNTWLYFAIQARRDDLLARATGAAQQHVSKGDVEQLGVPVPSRVVLDEFSILATPLLDLAAIAEFENRTLAATRDALLPQLMSGKLRVRDAEAIASDAGV